MNYTDLHPGRARRLMYSRNTYNIRPTDSFIVSRPNIINNQILTDTYIEYIIQQQRPQNYLQIQENLQQREHIQNLQKTVDIQNRRIENLQNIQIEERLEIQNIQNIQNIHRENLYQENLMNIRHNVQLINNKLIEKSQVCLNLFDDNFCVICQDNISITGNPRIIRVLECTHCFHINCIDKWFTTNNCCPTCKFELS